MQKTITLIILVFTMCFYSIAFASEYPAKPITLVAPYGAGGASDLAARSLAESVRKYLDDTPVVVVNKPGNGGMVGARFVSKSKPDGYTLLLARAGMSISPAVRKKSPLGWDAYSFLGILEATPMILAVNENSPFNSIQELVEALKKNPGTLTYAASGAMAIDGFTVQALLHDIGLNPLQSATLVPYRGGGALATALLGGHVDFLAIAGSSLMPHIKAGKIRPLMVYAPRRMESLSDVPTALELGYARAGQITGWSALYGPKKLPAPIVAKWQSALKQVAKDETWLNLASQRGSLSIINDMDIADYAKKQYMLYHELAKKFGYLE